jgi:ATP-dependent Clp protease ATP-binding subunit ClpC
MSKERFISRAVAVVLACALAFQPLASAAAVVEAPVLVPMGISASAGAAALAPTAAPLIAAPLASAPALTAVMAAPSVPTLAAAAPAAAAPAPAASAAQAAPAAAVPALKAAALNTAAFAAASVPADGAKAAAGRSFDLSAARPASADAVLGALGAASIPLAPSSSSRVSIRKAVPAIPVASPRWVARAKSYAPKALLAAGVVAAVSILHHFGLNAAAAAAPLAFLAGTLGTGEWKPTPAHLTDFMSLAAQAAPPGSVLGHDEAGRIGHALELDEPKVRAVLGELMRSGDLGMRDNQVFVHYSFAARVSQAPDPKTSADEGDRAALEAVKLLNSGAMIDHARGLTLASQALASYDKAEKETGARPVQRAEAEVLRGNLALEHVADLLRLNRAALAARPDGEFKTKRLAAIDAALAWLGTANFAAGRVPAMTRELQASLLEILQSINPGAETPEQLSMVTDAYVDAFDVIERYPPSALGISSAIIPADDGDSIGFALVREVMPGERIPDEAIHAAAAKMGWDVPRAYAALTKLGGRGAVAITDGGAVIMTSLGYRAEGENDQARRARAESLDAVKKFNTKDPIEHLRAVALLNIARNRYAGLLQEKDAHGSFYQETHILFANAILGTTHDALEAVGRAIDESLSGARTEPYGAMDRERLTAAAAEVKESLAWVKSVYYSADRRFEIPRKRAETLKNLLDLRAFREVVKGRINGDMMVVVGTRLTREFLARNAEGPRAVAGGAGFAPPPDDTPATPGGFRPLRTYEYPTLLKFGSDLTQKATDGKMKPMIGRKAELRQMIKTLLRVEKNNPLVIGEKGVGKTAIVNGLAQLIASGAIPELRGKNVIKIDLNKVVAGTSSRGAFEERMQGIIDEARKSEGRVILFIDEIHMLVGAGDAEGATDASQILKDSLADGSLSLIGATTLDEFRRIEKDGALMRRFNPVKLLPPTNAEAEAILEGLKPIYEKKHAVTIALETVKAAVALAARYVTDRHLPDSALDLMDDASAEVELRADENPATAREVTADDIAREISMRTGIPAGKLNEDKKAALKNLPAEMKGQVIGQDEAVEAVAEAVQAGEMGYRDPKQPIASFVFLGPTGVGKTELARALARIKFGSEKNMLRLDMSEYQEKHSVSRLVSAPPGYVGHDEGGQLTESIRRNPYQVILLDEIEKAHPDVFDVLLQVLEDGRLTDGQGRTVDFSNTIIIMTSNIGGSKSGEKDKADPKKSADGWRDGGDGFEYKQEGFGFTAKTLKRAKGGANSPERVKHYVDAFKEKYRPEFVNRVGEDRVIVFNEIAERSKLGLILDLRLKALEAQLYEKRLKVALTDAAREAVLTKALAQSEYGARPIKQIVDRQINQALKDAELSGRIAEGDAVLVDWDAAAGFTVR